MEKLTKIIYYFGIIFFSIPLFHSVVMLFLMNESIFVMKEAENIEIESMSDSLKIYINYNYIVDQKLYNDTYTMVLEYYERHQVDKIIVKYNKLFPFVSYIEGIPLKSRMHKLYILLFGFFILFIVCLWNFGNKEKWYKQREQVTNRPWIFPVDKTIKNPSKRFWKRLFNKELAE